MNTMKVDTKLKIKRTKTGQSWGIRRNKSGFVVFCGIYSHSGGPYATLAEAEAKMIEAAAQTEKQDAEDITLS
jgi:hypothetical protein